MGSRNLNVDIGGYMPEGVTEIITGGARGVDALAKEYASAHRLKLTVFRPDVAVLGKWAYLARNDQIVQAADMIIAIWDGSSKGTQYTIRQAQKLNKPVRVHIVPQDEKDN
ncbi:MAG: hypothetical protein LBS18_04390 [Clostridiales bacterium]|nr:hypothetical protein [Clostridiales bacterium]